MLFCIQQQYQQRLPALQLLYQISLLAYRQKIHFIKFEADHEMFTSIFCSVKMKGEMYYEDTFVA